MVLEIADIAVLAGNEEQFTDAYREAVDGVFPTVPGFRTARMTRGIESPSRFVLMIEWDDVEAHHDFRASEAFGRWRALVGPHFDGRPLMEHFADV